MRPHRAIGGEVDEASKLECLLRVNSVSMRDDFTRVVKDTLARRVGGRCSNPDCRRVTSGPREDPEGSVNIGVAAHICAGSRNGPRYDQRQDSAGRKSAENGIWLCQVCHKLVDSDPSRYSVQTLRRWKSQAEFQALLGLQTLQGRIEQSQERLRAYLRELVEKFNACNAARAYITRTGKMVGEGSVVDDAHEWLLEQSVAGTGLTLLLGEYGSGKTTECLRLAAALAHDAMCGASARIPFLVQLDASLSDDNGPDLSSYVSRATGLPLDEVRGLMLQGRVIVIADSLDELLATRRPSDRSRIMKRIFGGADIQGCTLVLSCRTHLFEHWHEAIELADCIAHEERGSDQTERVVAQLLEQNDAASHSTRTLVLRRVSSPEADEYMRLSGQADAWNVAKDSPGVSELAYQPVFLYLLSNVLGGLDKRSLEDQGGLSVCDLYDLAVRLWLRRDNSGSQIGDDMALTYLRELAVRDFTRIVHTEVDLGYSVRRWGSMRHAKELHQILVDVGVLVKDRMSTSFFHYSMFEHFLASAVAEELRSWKATLLASMNLIVMYSLNQFLVEQTLRLCGRRTLSGGRPARAVTRTEFAHFLRASGWRDGGSLWGYSRQRGGRVPPVQGTGKVDFDWGVPDLRGGSAVCNVSWYDAAMFARSRGARLPAQTDLTHGPQASNAEWLWTANWLDRSRSLMAIVGREGQVAGANPDVRDSAIGIAVVDPA